MSPNANPAARRPVVALLTDFGFRDSYVGTLKAVIAGIAPDANVIDLVHTVPPQDILDGALHLHLAHRFFPAGTVFCCVVDPGVGGARRAVAVRLHGDGYGPFVFVGPDNGLLTGMLVGGVVEAATVLDAPAYHRPVVSSTFHGRDVFAPVAAHVAAGLPVEAVGSALEPATLVRLPWQVAQRVGEGFEAAILHHDQFGNLITNLAAATLGPDLSGWRVLLDEVEIGTIHRAFSDVAKGHPLAYVGSSGLVEIGVRDGNARQVLNVKPTSLVRVLPVQAGNGGSAGRG